MSDERLSDLNVLDTDNAETISNYIKDSLESGEKCNVKGKIKL